MSFLEGLVGGLATGLDTGIRRQIDQREKRISEIAKLRAAKVIEESGKHATQFKATKNKIRSYAGIVNNDMNLVQHAIQTYGLDGAEEYLKNLKTVSDNSGGAISTSDLVKIDRDPNANITANQLTQFVVGEAPRYSPLDPSKVTENRGILGFFDPDYSDQVNARSNELISAVNNDTGIPVNISKLAPVSSSGEKTWLINAPNDPKEKLEYFKTVSNAYLKKYNNFEDKSSPEAEKTLSILKEVSNSHRAAYELFNVDNQQDNMTDSQRLSIEKKLRGDIGIYMYTEGVYVADGFGGSIYEVENADQKPIILSMARHMSNELQKISTATNPVGKKIDVTNLNIRDVMFENLEKGLITDVIIDYGNNYTAPTVVDFEVRKIEEVYPTARGFFEKFYQKIDDPFIGSASSEDNPNLQSKKEDIIGNINSNLLDETDDTDDTDEEREITDLKDVTTYKELKTMINKAGGISRAEKINVIKDIYKSILNGKVYLYNGDPIRADQFKSIYEFAFKK